MDALGSSGRSARRTATANHGRMCDLPRREHLQQPAVGLDAVEHARDVGPLGRGAAAAAAMRSVVDDALEPRGVADVDVGRAPCAQDRLVTRVADRLRERADEAVVAPAAQLDRRLPFAVADDDVDVRRSSSAFGCGAGRRLGVGEHLRVRAAQVDADEPGRRGVVEHRARLDAVDPPRGQRVGVERRPVHGERMCVQLGDEPGDRVRHLADTAVQRVPRRCRELDLEPGESDRVPAHRADAAHQVDHRAEVRAAVLRRARGRRSARSPRRAPTRSVSRRQGRAPR